jgi:hypothetical protein
MYIMRHICAIVNPGCATDATEVAHLPGCASIRIGFYRPSSYTERKADRVFSSREIRERRGTSSFASLLAP